VDSRINLVHYGKERNQPEPQLHTRVNPSGFTLVAVALAQLTGKTLASFAYKGHVELGLSTAGQKSARRLFLGKRLGGNKTLSFRFLSSQSVRHAMYIRGT
jgi:hypothetical protein